MRTRLRNLLQKLKSRKRRSELLEDIKRKEERIEFLTSERDKERERRIALEERVEHLEGESSFEGPVTQFMSKLNTAMGYIDRGMREKAERAFDVIFQSVQGTEIEFYQAIPRLRKVAFILDTEMQLGASLRHTWVCINYEDREEAEVSVAVYQSLVNSLVENIVEEAPTLPDVEPVGKYVLTSRVFGPTLDRLYQELDQKPDSKAKEVLLKVLLRKQLRDAAIIRTRKFGLEERLLEESDHVAKALEVFEYAVAHVGEQERNKLSLLLAPIDEAATYHFRDAASWNYCINEEAFNYFLSDDYLSRDPSHLEVEAIVQSSVISLDWDKLRRLTFQSDDAIHTLEWPHPRIKPETRAELEDYFVGVLAQFGEDVGSYHSLRTLSGFYRHIRMWLFYNLNPENYPDPDGSCRGHHLRRGYATLYTSLNGEDPSEAMLADIDMQDVLNLVMHPNCRPGAIQ